MEIDIAKTRKADVSESESAFFETLLTGDVESDYSLLIYMQFLIPNGGRIAPRFATLGFYR